MGKVLKKIGIISSLASRYIGIIIIAFSCLAFFWRDGFSWMTNYTSVFLGVIMFGMGLTIKLDDFRAIFSRPKEVVIGAVAQYTIMPVIAWLLCKVMNLPADLALGVILVGCCPGGTASNVITYIAGGDVALSVGMTIVSTLAAPLMTPFLVYVLAGAWVEVSFWAMVLSVVKVILIPVLLGVFLRSLAGEHVAFTGSRPHKKKGVAARKSRRLPWRPPSASRLISRFHSAFRTAAHGSPEKSCQPCLPFSSFTVIG